MTDKNDGRIRTFLIFLIIGALIQYIVPIHIYLGEGYKYDGFYAPYFIMILEMMFFFMAELCSFAILIYFLAKKYPRKIWAAPLLFSLGVPSLFVFGIPIAVLVPSIAVEQIILTTLLGISKIGAPVYAGWIIYRLGVKN